MSNIYVTGANGQIGGEIRRLMPGAYYLSKSELDLSSENAIHDFFINKKVDLIINCAAYTLVDQAESEIGQAFQINDKAAGLLARYSKKFIHFSTDYVFDGTKGLPYTETDIPNPINIYGKSKLAGEHAVLNTNPEAVVIRTSWVYSDIGNNFVKTMLRLGSNRDEIKVVNDQLGSPTYAKDLAGLVVNCGAKNWAFQGGIYNFTNEGSISWSNFAQEIYNQKKINCKVVGIPSKEYPTKASRPVFSVLDKSKIKQELNIVIPNWKESLEQCLKLLS